MNATLELLQLHAQIRTRRNMRRFGVALFFLLAVFAFCACTPVQSYVQADRAIYDAVAPAHRAYVTADPALSAEQKDRRFRTLEEWRKLVETAELGQAPATRPSR